MKIVAIILYIIALTLGSFGYWGVYTRAGSQHYDEMAGIIPGAALLMAMVCLITAVILSLLLYFKNRKV